MKTYSEAEQSFLNDMFNSEGWKIYSKWVGEQIEMKRKKATQREVELNDRLWYSAEASGMEKSLSLKDIIN